MKFVAMEELQADTSKILDGLDEDGVIVTRDGKPAAALVHLEEDFLEEYVLTHDPTLVKALEDALAEYREKGGVDHETMKRMIGRGR